MNVFSTLKTVFFGSKVLSRPVPADGAPRRDLAIALNGLLPLCRAVPGMHLAVDIREGRASLVMDWTPRTDGKALAGAYHYVVSGESGVREVIKPQVILAESDKENLPENRDEAFQSLTVPEEISSAASETVSSAAPKNIEEETMETSPKVANKKKAKSCSLMQEVAAFLTSRYHFRFNVLTEETEVAPVESSIPDTHLRYAKVDERWMNSLSLETIEAGIDCWDRDIQRFVRSRRIGEYHPFTAYFEGLPEWDGTDRVTALARRVSDNPVWVNGFHRWMLGLSAQWMQFHPDSNSVSRANSVAPLLVSSRQGLGKSTFCRLLMPDALKAYYTESYDLSSPASAEAKLAAYGLINLDEFDKLGASKMPLLKNLMQASA
ncbi:VapE domain-containing protein, partial [Phocaeicola sp.]|uniref:VapE domain-containing protein n=1 Tax=Phocaeicola sp. TaxID=2773926 RepID=UPI0023C37F51